ncbi:MAG: hypothetical protein ACFKPT_02500 [Gloeotrichia echinulata GP01]
MSYWRDEARITINEAIAGIDLTNLSEQQKKELRCAIDASYPFGIRRNHPYKIWMDERRKAFYRLGLSEPSALSNQKKADQSVPGQMSIFDFL